MFFTGVHNVRTRDKGQNFKLGVQAGFEEQPLYLKSSQAEEQVK